MKKLDFLEKQCYINSAFTEKQKRCSLKTEQNVNSNKLGKTKQTKIFFWRV